jgi:predicted dinucleotide-binding enzyme
MTEVIVVIGAGSIGQAIARRIGSGRHVLLADLREDNAAAATGVLLDAGWMDGGGTASFWYGAVR